MKNEFIKLSMGMPPQLDHENVMKIMYCAVSYYRSPLGLKELWILIIKHFNQHLKRINELML